MIQTEEENRLAPRIEHVRKCLAARVRVDNGQPLPASFDAVEFERSLDNSILEHFRYQTLQSEAFAMGKLTLYEAQTIYMALGERPGASGWAADTDLATKVIVTEVLGELARAGLATRRG